MGKRASGPLGTAGPRRRRRIGVGSVDALARRLWPRHEVTRIQMRRFCARPPRLILGLMTALVGLHGAAGSRRCRCGAPPTPAPRERSRQLGAATRSEWLSGRPIQARALLWPSARSQGAGPVPGLARDRAQPECQEPLRRLFGKRRNRDLQAQLQDRCPHPAQGSRGMHRRKRWIGLRQCRRTRCPQLGCGQRRRPQRLCDLSR